MFRGVTPTTMDVFKWKFFPVIPEVPAHCTDLRP